MLAIQCWHECTVYVGVPAKSNADRSYGSRTLLAVFLGTVIAIAANERSSNKPQLLFCDQLYTYMYMFGTVVKLELTS